MFRVILIATALRASFATDSGQTELIGRAAAANPPAGLKVKSEPYASLSSGS